MNFASGSVLGSTKSRGSAAAFAEESAAALSQGEAPDPAPFEKAVAAYDAEIAAMRAEGLTRKLSGDDVERLFGLGFAFEQLRQDFRELSRAGWPMFPASADGGLSEKKERRWRAAPA